MIRAGLRHDQEERIGWCPVCFGEYVTELKDGGPELALHGYRRPGHGYIVGRCPGSGEVPLDVSPDGLKRSIDRMTARLAELDGATVPGAAEERRSLEVRIAFARRELADWRPGEEIPGLRRRRQPAMNDDEIRLRLDSGIAARKRLPPPPEPPKDVRPFLTVVLTLPNPLADEAERRRDQGPPKLSGDESKQTEETAARVPRRGPGRPRTKADQAPPDEPQAAAEIDRSALDRLRTARRRRLDHLIEIERIEIEAERLRLAAGATAKAWLAAVGATDAKRPEASYRRRDGAHRITVDMPLGRASWDRVAEIGERLGGAQRSDKAAPPGVVWTVDAADLEGLAAALGVPAADTRRSKLSLRNPAPKIIAFEDLPRWNGKDPVLLADSLNWWQVGLGEMTAVQRTPEWLSPFLKIVGGRLPGHAPTDVWLDIVGNAVVRTGYTLDWCDRCWKVVPFHQLCNHDQACETLDLNQDDVDGLLAAGVVALLPDGQVAVADLVSDHWEREKITSLSLSTVAEVLAAPTRRHPPPATKRRCSLSWVSRSKAE